MRAPGWVLDAERDLDVGADAADAETALREVAGHRPTVLVLDLAMPGRVEAVAGASAPAA